MKIAKRCVYCATNYNLLPALLVTPLLKMKCLPDMQPEPGTAMQDPERRDHWEYAGFRIAFKFWTFHFGLEVHYES